MDRFMKIAVDEAKRGVRAGHGGPFGAVIVRDGKVIARGHNRVIVDKDPTCHAEMIAIRKASSRLKRFHLNDCEIYITGEPCPMCLAAILWARIPKVHYGCSKSDSEKIGFDDKEFYKVIKGTSRAVKMVKGADREGCLQVFREWKEKEDKVLY